MIEVTKSIGFMMTQPILMGQNEDDCDYVTIFFCVLDVRLFGGCEYGQM